MDKLDTKQLHFLTTKKYCFSPQDNLQQGVHSKQCRQSPILEGETNICGNVAGLRNFSRGFLTSAL